MFIAIVWIIVSSLLVLWSLAAWGVHAVGVWAASNAGSLSGAAASVGGLHLPQWLAAWVPPELAVEGKRFQIKSNDRLAEGRVVLRPFYDPDGARLKS